MRAVRLSTLVTILVAFAAALVLLKWVLLPLLLTVDPTGSAGTILSYATPPAAIVWAMIVLLRDSKKEEQ